MLSEELQVVEIREDFYRDSFGKVLFIIISICTAIAILIAVSLYLFLNQPPPVTFAVDEEWRVQPEVRLTEPYLSDPDLLQWVTDAITKSFIYDFLHYSDQLKANNQYFTPDGWKIFLNQLNIYANYNNVQTNKLFINATPAGAPTVINRGVLSGRYVWWVQIPIVLSYLGTNQAARTLSLQILVVRVSTLNNLNGVAIDNVIVQKNTPGNANVTGTVT